MDGQLLGISLEVYLGLLVWVDLRGYFLQR